MHRPRACLLQLVFLLATIAGLSAFAPRLEAQPRATPAASASAASAGDDKKPAPPARRPGPAERVTVGLVVNQIHELSLKDNFFVVDFYVWFRWKAEELKPYETFELVDGRIESKREVTRKTIGDTEYAYVRVVAKMTKFWDISDYPFDRHELRIVIEEDQSEDDAVVYDADVTNFGIDQRLSLPGWRVERSGLEAQRGSYASNFGDISLPTGKLTHYAQCAATIEIGRRGGAFFAKTFFALWISAAIAFLCFFIKPTNVDPRFGLGVGAIFAAIASEYVVTNGLPETGVITLADRLHLVAFGFIFLAIAQSTLSLWMFENGREKWSQRFDRITSLGVPLVYVIINVLLVSRR